jgi:hypothetical protein
MMLLGAVPGKFRIALDALDPFNNPTPVIVVLYSRIPSSFKDKAIGKVETV